MYFVTLHSSTALSPTKQLHFKQVNTLFKNIHNYNAEMKPKEKHRFQRSEVTNNDYSTHACLHTNHGIQLLFYFYYY